MPYGPTVAVHRGWAPIFRNGMLRSKSFGRKGQSGPSSQSIPPSTGSSSPSQLEDEDLSREELAASKRRSGQQIEFVNATGSSIAKDPAVRKRVRSHVMKGVARDRRERRKLMLKRAEDKLLALSPSPELPSSLGGTRHSVSSSNGNGTLEGERGIVPAALVSAVSLQAIAPEIQWHLSAFPDIYTPNARKPTTIYFEQFATAMYPNEHSLTFNPIEARIKFYMSDSVIFHAMLYVTAVSSSLFGGDTESGDVTIELGMTMELVNGRLAGKADERTSDAVISAVARLAFGEALRGNYGNWAIHMAGLKILVELKGGLSNLHSCIRTNIHNADLVGSISQLIPPFFHFGRWERTFPAYKDTPFSKKITKPNNIGLHGKGIPSALATALKELRNFSHDIERTFDSGAPKIAPQHFIESCFSLQYQFLTATQISTLVTEQRPLEVAFAIAGLIYMKLILRDIHHRTGGSIFLIQEYKASLSVLLDSIADPSILMWPLFMGGLASRHSPDRTWFVSQLVIIIDTLGIDVWEGLKEELDKVVWFARTLDASGERLWQEMEIKRKMLAV